MRKSPPEVVKQDSIEIREEAGGDKEEELHTFQGSKDYQEQSI